MKNLKQIFILGIVFLVLVFLTLEISLRFLVVDKLPLSIKYKIDEKEIHCYNDDLDLIQLCPNIQMRLISPLGFSYNLTTNAMGERITSNMYVAKNNQEKIDEGSGINTGVSDAVLDQSQKIDKFSHVESIPKLGIWAIGDSLTMGYGINDDESLPFLLATKGFQVRNLASDSLGSNDIYKILKSNLGKRITDPSESNQAKNQKNGADFIVWVFSRSDFYDDLKSNSKFQNFLRKQSFKLSKKIRSLIVARAILENWRIQRSSNDYNFIQKEQFVPPADNHPTLVAIKNIRKLSFDANIDPIVVLAPDWDHLNGDPELNTECFKFMKTYFTKLEFNVVDMSEFFDNRKGSELYIPNDGHPSANANKLIGIEVSRILRSLPKHQ
ncbi:hypothetical protein [Leptospira sp. GIMC2001]|uniref:hypothetical protein n=1 Tax=Leptospira sp. GIMC2001 TaxID=1513297 RepID=UPI00234BE75C|nr:hypothetical protein [Leptospira sp. GIMC2001]WCL48895.1 hypothetical protein O4O04_16575 [Leptospira sp. GIMC2001]